MSSLQKSRHYWKSGLRRASIIGTVLVASALVWKTTPLKSVFDSVLSRAGYILGRTVIMFGRRRKRSTEESQDTPPSTRRRIDIRDEHVPTEQIVLPEVQEESRSRDEQNAQDVTDLTEHEEVLIELQDELGRRDEQTAQHVTELSQHEKELGELQKKLRRREKQINQHVTNLAQHAEELNELENKLRRRGEQLAQHVPDLARLKEELTGLENKLRSRGEQLAQHIPDLAWLKEELTELQDKLRSRDEQIAQHVSTLTWHEEGPPRLPPRSRLSNPLLKVKLNTKEKRLQLMGILGIGDGCIVSCKGRAVRLDSEGQGIVEYKAAKPWEFVSNMCIYDKNLYLIQYKSITVHQMKSISELIASSGSDSREASFSMQSVEGTCHEVPNAELLSGGVAIGPNTLVLVDLKKGEVNKWEVGASSSTVLQKGLQKPNSICTRGESDEIQYVVTDYSGHSVQVYGSRGDLLHTFGGEGVGEGQLHHPWDVAITEEGTLLVSDTDNARLCEFGQDGVFLNQLLQEQLGGQPTNISLSPPFLWVKAGEHLLKFKIYCS